MTKKKKTAKRSSHSKISSPSRRANGSSSTPAKIQQLTTKLDRLNEWRRRLNLILKYAKRASTVTDINELLALMVEEAKAVLGAERATVFIADRQKSELWSKVASGTKTIRIPIDKGIAGAVASSKEILNIKDVYKDHRFNPEVDKKTGFKTTSCLTAPMLNQKGDVIGVFQVLNRLKGTAFDRQDEEILLLLADQAAGNLEASNLYQEVKRAAEETVIRLAGAVEFKDYDTRHHLSRMSKYSAIIAREMGFPPDWCENLRLAAPMHDIGKIGVPDHILKKPGRLTPEEWVEMKKHPQYGADILKGSDNELMQMSSVVALYHHERWDGKGYPNGAKGEEIPIEARIASLADVFDALTSKRIYKPSWSLEKTLDVIREERGSQFDPSVVDAFFACLNKITPIMEEMAPRDDEEPVTNTNAG